MPMVGPMGRFLDVVVSCNIKRAHYRSALGRHFWNLFTSVGIPLPQCESPREGKRREGGKDITHRHGVQARKK